MASLDMRLCLPPLKRPKLQSYYQKRIILHKTQFNKLTRKEGSFTFLLQSFLCCKSLSSANTAGTGEQENVLWLSSSSQLTTNIITLA